jgi:RNA recognition motif-containing protein
MRLFISNINFAVTTDELIAFLEEYGEPSNTQIILDRDTKESRGFGFAELPDLNAQALIDERNGTKCWGRKLRIREARPRGERPRKEQREHTQSQ